MIHCISHTFHTELLPPLAGDLAWNVRYTETSVLLEVLAALLGADFNEDGDIDGEDFLAWQTGYGRFPGGGAAHADGDADGDGDVDGDDFLAWHRGFGLLESAEHADGDANGDLNVENVDLTFWQNQFGDASESVATITVPEPSAMSLVSFLVAVVCLLGPVRPRRRSP